MAYSDPERQRAYAREWLRRNPQKARDAVRRWNKSHPEQRRALKRAYYARNSDRLNIARAAWLKLHPGVRRAKESAYRARARAAAGQFTSAEWLGLVERYAGRCAYCGRAGLLQAEHRVPLSRGGTNSIDNILPACARCNTRKATLTEDEFRARLALQRESPSPPIE